MNYCMFVKQRIYLEIGLLKIIWKHSQAKKNEPLILAINF